MSLRGEEEEEEEEEGLKVFCSLLSFSKSSVPEGEGGSRPPHHSLAPGDSWDGGPSRGLPVPSSLGSGISRTRPSAGRTGSDLSSLTWSEMFLLGAGISPRLPLRLEPLRRPGPPRSWSGLGARDSDSEALPGGLAELLTS